MKQLPNIITSLRIAGSLGLLFCDVANNTFWLVYGLCGISDIVDAPADTRTAAMVMAVGWGNCCD